MKHCSQDCFLENCSRVLRFSFWNLLNVGFSVFLTEQWENLNKLTTWCNGLQKVLEIQKYGFHGKILWINKLCWLSVLSTWHTFNYWHISWGTHSNWLFMAVRFMTNRFYPRKTFTCPIISTKLLRMKVDVTFWDDTQLSFWFPRIFLFKIVFLLSLIQRSSKRYHFTQQTYN